MSLEHNAHLITFVSRYLQLFREQADKHRKIKQEQMNKLSEKEQKLREEDERRQYMVHKRHMEVTTAEAALIQRLYLVVSG